MAEKRVSTSSAPKNEEEEQGWNNYNDDDEMTTMMEQPPPFAVDQRVYCRDNQGGGASGGGGGGFIYPALVKRIALVQPHEYKFWVHYLGWNARHDAWRSAYDLLEDSVETQQLYRQQEANNRTITTTATTDTSTSSRKRNKSTLSPNRSSPSHNKRSTTSLRKQQQPISSSRTTTTVHDDCALPWTLQTVLVEEWEKINRPPHIRQLHPLPAKTTVHAILQHFAQRQQQNQEETKVNQYVQGLTTLFEQALPICLLYPQERIQYQNLMTHHHHPSSTTTTTMTTTDATTTALPLTQWYGGEYLLRLLVRLPHIMTHMNPDTGKFTRELIVLMQKNRQGMFGTTFRLVQPEELLPGEQQSTSSSSSSKKRVVPMDTSETGQSTA